MEEILVREYKSPTCSLPELAGVLVMQSDSVSK